LGLLEGDHRHTYETGEMAGRSVDQQIAIALQIDFLGTSALIRLHPWGFEEEHYEGDTILYAHHGVGYSRLAGTQLNRVEDLMRWINADIFLMGHSHAKVNAPVDQQNISPDGIHYHRTKIIARTGGWLRAYLSRQPQPLEMPASVSRGSYVEQKAMAPSSLGGRYLQDTAIKQLGDSEPRPEPAYLPSPPKQGPLAQPARIVEPGLVGAGCVQSDAFPPFFRFSIRIKIKSGDPVIDRYSLAFRGNDI
jgi:hypothetical protein